MRAILAFLVLACSALHAQTNRLTFRPADAEYSSSLNRIIMMSASPNVLHVYDPVTRTDQTVSLSKVPLSLAVSPDGKYAAVGHDASISYVNLQTRAVEKTLTVTGSVQRLVLGADSIYFISATGVLQILKIATGAVTQGVAFGYSNSMRLHPSGIAIYGTDAYGYYQGKYDLTASTNQVKTQYTGYSASQCNRLWLSPDGARIYGACATVYRASTDASLDLTWLMPVSGLSSLTGVSESASAGRVAIIPNYEANSSGSNQLVDNQVRLYDRVSLREIGRFRMPGFAVGNNSYAAHGRWIFLDSAGANMHVVVQADTASGLLNDFAVQTVKLNNPDACFASFTPTSVSAPGPGTVAEVAISADDSCIFRASAGAAWIQVISGGFGSGNSTMRFHVRANSGGARSGTITMGTQTLTINQAAAVTTGTQQRFSYPIVDAKYSKALDRLVSVSAGPDELHIYDPVARTEQFVALTHTPLSVSVQPDGLRAAVGHNGFVSYVNLQTASVERIYTVPGRALDVVLAGNGYVYVFASSGYNAGQLHSVLLSSGAVTTVNGAAGPDPARLYSTGNYIYSTAGSYVSKWDLRQGAATAGAFNNNVSTCGNLWLSEDGVRMYTACGGVFRTSEVPQQDGLANGSFAAVGSSYYSYSGYVAWAAHSASKMAIAVLPNTSGYPYYSSAQRGEVQLYADDGLILQGRLLLTQFNDGSAVHEVAGKFAFWSKANDRILVVSQVNSSASLPSPFVLESITPAAIQGCAISLGANSANVQSSGGPVNIQVNTGAGCLWNATATEYWLGLDSSTASGSGSGTLKLNVNSNYPNTTTRSAVINVSGQQFTVNQAASSGLRLYTYQTAFSSAFNSGYAYVETSSTRSWTASSSASWLTLTTTSGTGYGSIAFQLAANTGAARSATITVGVEVLTITQDAAPGTPGSGMRFVPVTPCRVSDSRVGLGLYPGGFSRTTQVGGVCGIPNGAAAYSLNVTVVPQGVLGYLTIWPSDQTRPFVSTLNSFDGRVKANAAIVPASLQGYVSVYVTDATHVILDVNGYFIPTAGANTSTSHPFNAVKPCRVVDTRTGNGGSMAAGQSRTFAIRSVTGCDAVPTNVAAYSLNITAIPKSGALGYLTTWAAGATQPFVSTLNSFTGTVVANAAIVPAGTNGDISVFVTDAADVVIDINGYFGPGGTNPLLFYPKTPCRISDSRQSNSSFGGPILSAGVARAWPVPNGTCGMPSTAAAYVLNATVVPSTTLGYLTLWPSGAAQPLVSTLNSFDGSITANAAIVPAGVGGAVSSYPSNNTHLILDTTGYFGQ